ncbi:hypothetical protein HRbin08_01387 [bacterium HR08]|nr:hypothetical protein HRbin08_01387 [bacterium HR08]
MVRATSEVVCTPPRGGVSWSEIGGGALVAFGLTVLYESRLTGVFEQVRYLLSPHGHWDALSARYLFGALGVAAREGIGWLVLVGGIFVPAVLLFGNAFSVREPLLVFWRRWYRQVLGATLYGWAIAHGVMAVPALWVFSAETPRYEAALGVAVLPPFAFLMGCTLRQIFSMSLGRVLAILLPALVSLLAAPIVGKRFVLVAASPMLVLIGHQLLTPYLHRALRAARDERTRPDGQAAGIPEGAVGEGAAVAQAAVESSVEVGSVSEPPSAPS